MKIVIMRSPRLLKPLLRRWMGIKKQKIKDKR